MKKLLFLYNTHAGKGLLKSRLAAVQDALAAAGWDVTIHPTQGLFVRPTGQIPRGRRQNVRKP